MDDKKTDIQRIFNLCLDIQMQGNGENGFPYVSFGTSNYGTFANVYIMENGFEKDKVFSAYYDLEEPVTRVDCKRYLEELLNRIQPGLGCNPVQE